VAKWVSTLLGLGVLGDSLGALRHGVLGQLTRQEKPDCSLDLSGGDGAAPVVVGQAGGLCGDALKDVIHEGVHDRHGLGADASVGVDLLQHLVDVDGVALPPPPPALLIPSSLGLGLAGGLLSSFARGFGWHVVCMTLGNTENEACRPIRKLLYEPERDIGHMAGFELSQPIRAQQGPAHTKGSWRASCRALIGWLISALAM
jgi:hypothetical protein